MRRCAETLESEMSEAEQAFLVRLIKQESFSGPHLEIGTAAGGTLCRMMQCFSDETRPKFVVVDRMTYFPNQPEAVATNLRQHGLNPDDVDFRSAKSSDAFHDATRRGDRFDFILIDASHKILAVMSDLRWLRLLNVGGAACFHDYTNRFPGVRLSISRFLKHHANYETIGTADSLLAIRKTSPREKREVSTSDFVYSYAMYLPLEIHRKISKWRSRRQNAT